MKPIKAEINYSFGTFIVEIEAKGRPRSPEPLADNAQSAVITTLGSQVRHSGIIGRSIARSEEGTNENFRSSAQYGSIEVICDVNFMSEWQIHRSLLNGILGNVFSTFNKVVRTHLMDEATEREALQPQPAERVLVLTDELVGAARIPSSITDPVLFDDPMSYSRSGSRQPQLAGR